MHEKLHILPFIRVDGRYPSKIRFDRAFAFNRVNKRARRAAVVITEMRELRGAVEIVFVTTGNRRIIGREERRK